VIADHDRPNFSEMPITIGSQLWMISRFRIARDPIKILTTKSESSGHPDHDQLNPEGISDDQPIAIARSLTHSHPSHEINPFSCHDAGA
jgi:hypothetical protein